MLVVAIFFKSIDLSFMSSSFLVSVSRLGLFPPRGGVLGPLFMLLGLIFLNLDLIGSEDVGLWDPQVHVLTPELWGTKSLSRHPQKPQSCRHFPRLPFGIIITNSTRTARQEWGLMAKRPAVWKVVRW